MKIPGYTVHRKIGSGGMASVYLATQESFDRKVALKIIANKSFGGDEQAQRFNREAKIIAGLSHPHIVPVYDVGTIGHYQYLAMDYLPGGELNTLIKAGLEPKESLEIICQIAHALHFAHNKGYIHRDVKPDNIMFREDLSAVLTDFGIARPREEDTGMTQHGLVIGTPSYMSPEQSQNKTIDGRSDLYALGVIFYLMLTKKLPYVDKDPLALALKHIKDPIPQLPSNLQQYQVHLDKLLAKNPDHRYKSGLELVKALKNSDQELSKKVQPVESIKENSESKSELTVNKQPIVTTTKTKHLQIKESTYRKMGLLKRHRFQAIITSDDYQHFSLLYNQLTIKLMAWWAAHEKEAGQVLLYFHIPKGMQTQAQAKITKLSEKDSPFVFLKKLDFKLEFAESETA